MASVGRSILQTRLHTCFFWTCHALCGRLVSVVLWLSRPSHTRKDAGSSPAGNRVSRVCILENPIAGPSEVMVGAHNSRYPGFKGLWGI